MVQKGFCLLLSIIMLFSSTTPTFASDSLTATQNEEVRVIDANPESMEVTITDGINEYIINTQDETISKNGINIIKYETTVDFVNPELGITEEEALATEKERRFADLSTAGISTFNYTATYIPQSAPYTVYATYTTNISEMYGQMADVLKDVSLLTKLFALANIAYAPILLQASAAAKVSSKALETASGIVSATHTYTMHKTKQTYQYYNSIQYGYRYAHGSLGLTLKVFGQTFYKKDYYSGIGTWWVANKPF